MGKMIIIPDIDCMDEDNYDETIQLLDSLPIKYEIWDSQK